MPPSSLHAATNAFIASVISWFSPGEPANPASSPSAIVTESAVTPGTVPVSVFGTSAGPHGQGASPNAGSCTAGSVGGVVVASPSVEATLSGVLTSGGAVVSAA